MTVPARWCLRSALGWAVLLCGSLALVTNGLAGEEPFDIVLPTHAVRHLELVSGERLLVEDVRGDDGGLTFRWNGSTRCRLPLALVRSVANPPGWIDRLEERFDTLRVPKPHSGRGAWQSPGAAPWQYRCDPALAAGELAFWGRTDNTPAATFVRLTFDAHDQATALELKLGPPAVPSVAVPEDWCKTFSQPLRTSDGWSRVAVQWRDQRCEIRVNHAVHSVFATPDLRLQSIVLEPHQSSTLTVDDLVLREFRPEIVSASPPLRVAENVDTVTLIDGDQLFGEFAAADVPSAIALQGEQVTWAGDWSEVTRIDFARRPLPPHAFAPVRGVLCDVSSLTEPTLLRNLRVGERSAHHLWLGTVPRPSMDRANIRYGEFRWLEPDRRHLGDEIRADLSPPVPVGTSIGGTIDFVQPPRGLTWVVVDVAEMEPSGPETPPTQPFLDALRGGGLRTELVVNDRVITDLNRFLRARSRVTHPERLWLPVPSAAWHAGSNAWSLRQRPLSTENQQYDDAEVGRIALWTTPF